MYLVGLNGGIASGKSTVAIIFKQYGVEIIDTDQVARDVVAIGTPALQEIANYFGPDILEENGSLDRNRLRHSIFGQDENRVWLENLLHPLICKESLNRAKKSSAPYCLILIPLLMDSPLRNALNYLIVMDIQERRQIQRATSRDQCDEALIEKIIASQQPQHYRLEQADAVVDNNLDLAHLEKQVATLHEQLLVLAQ